jgi:hypothetical protein
MSELLICSEADAASHTKTFNQIYNFLSVVDFGIVHDKNAQRAQKG